MIDCSHESVAVVTRRSLRGTTSSVECEDCGVGFVPRETVGTLLSPIDTSIIRDLMGAAGMGHRAGTTDGMIPAEAAATILVPAIRKLTVDAARGNKCSPCHDNFEHPFRGEVHMHPDGVFYLPFEADLEDLDAAVAAAAPAR